MIFLEIKPPTSGHLMEPSVLILDQNGRNEWMNEWIRYSRLRVPYLNVMNYTAWAWSFAWSFETYLQNVGWTAVGSAMKPFIAIISLEQHDQGRARTQSPTTRNYAIEIPTFGEFARVSNSLSAMAEPRYGWTTFLIMVSPLPGKYELYTFRWAERCPRVFP
mgnify:CR=1 FL=1